mmetsp:Transcript_27848/g.56042  ORF Transcript_27848/g.56042 Transcript_27848/m.56042 type:complete len:107 (-) Transcript_27848:530-850(-)
MSGAIGALRTGLPDSMNLDISMASDESLSCLRRASLALQAEFHGSRRACEAFLTNLASLESASTASAAPNRDALAFQRETLALQREVASLQSATDAQMSMLHELVS